MLGLAAALGDVVVAAEAVSLVISYSRSPPVPQPPVLHNEPESGVRHARRALRQSASPARRPARRGRVGPSAEEPRDDFGSLGPQQGAAARQQRPNPQQVPVVLQHLLLIRTGEAHAFENRQRLLVFCDELGRESGKSRVANRRAFS